MYFARFAGMSAGLFVSVFTQSAALAQDDPIIVTATRTAQTADETLSPVIVISREELETETGSQLVDILHRIPGVDVSRSGGPSQQSSIFIRGAEGDHTLVMVNGITINPGTLGYASIQNIPLEMIERIEIVKGPRSTLYGSDAIGGVINIITREQTAKGSHYEASLGGGSFGTKSASLAAYNNTGDRSAGINISGTQSDGFPTLSTETLDRGYDNLSIQLYGKKRLGETQATIEHWQSQGNVEYFGYDNLFNLVPLEQDFKTSTTAVSFDNNPTANWSSKVRLSYFDDNLEQTQSTDYVRTRRATLEWQNDIQAGDAQLISVGLSLADEDTAAIRSTSFYGSDTNINAVYLQDNITAGQHQLVIGARYTDHETFGDHTTGNIEYGYQLSKQWKVIAAGNTGFRAPSSTDLFGSGGNPDLKPEESENRELGLRFKQGAHRFNLNAFDNQIDNLIDYVGVWPTGTNQNIDKTRIKGVEAGYEYDSSNWLFALNAIDQDPRNVSDNTQLLKRPEQKYSLSVAHKGDAHRLQMDVTYVSDRFDYGDPSPILLDSYTLVGLKGLYAFTDKLTATLRIENVTDEEYELVDNYNTPERSYYVKLGYTF